MIEEKIVDVDRNPRIAGTRITVYTILEFVRAGWRPDDIAFWFDLTRAQVDAATLYIEENKEEVAAEYEKIMKRIKRGNPPELQAKLDAGHERFLAMVKELRAAKAWEAGNAGHSGGH